MLDTEAGYTGTHEKDESEDNTSALKKCSCKCGQPVGWCTGSV
jgi:hypothetical protein